MKRIGIEYHDTTANANSCFLHHMVQCEDCGRTVSIFEASEQTTFEGTKIRCESCSDAAWKRAIDRHFNIASNAQSDSQSPEN